MITRIERDAKRRHKAATRTGVPERFSAYAADALLACTSGPTAHGRGREVELVIVCDLYAWRRGHAHDGEPCQLQGGGPIPVEVAKALANDAFLKAVLHDGVDIHRVRHFGRRFSKELLTALDLGPAPTFLGRACARCKRTFGLERDHRLPVASNGPTSYDNLQDLCYPCHQEKTERDRLAGRLGPKAKARAPGKSEKNTTAGTTGTAATGATAGTTATGATTGTAPARKDGAGGKSPPRPMRPSSGTPPGADPSDPSDPSA